MQPACEVGLLLGPTVVGTVGFCDFAEVTRPGRRDDENLLAGALFGGKRGGQVGACFVGQRVHHPTVELVGAGVVELRGDGPHHGKVVVLSVPQIVVALELLPHVAQGVLGAALVKLVDGHHIGEVEHVDLLELRGSSKFRRHHVQRDVAVVHDLGVALADATGLKNNQVELSGL